MIGPSALGDRSQETLAFSKQRARLNEMFAIAVDDQGFASTISVLGRAATRQSPDARHCGTTLTFLRWGK
jgi:hypothetical protein